jgi:RHS repeat-associated protein
LQIEQNIGTELAPVYRTSQMRYDAQGRVATETDPLGNQTTYTYNIVGHVLTTTLPATGQTGVGQGRIENEYLYPGGPLLNTKIYNESNIQVRQVTYTYDDMDRLLTITGGSEDVRYEYDALGRVSAQYDGNNHCQSIYTYNSRGLLESETLPGASTISTVVRSFEYDVVGNVTRRLEQFADNTSIKDVGYVYDDIEGLLTEINYVGDSSRDVEITYDSYGRRSIVTDSVGSQTFSYGSADQVTAIETTYSNLPSKTISYSYYHDGSRSLMTTPGGNFEYLYDVVGRFISFTNPFNESFGWTYSENDRLQRQTMSNGLETDYSCNAQGQLTDLINQLGNGPSAVLLSQFSSISYDGAGNRLAVAANLPSVTSYSGLTEYQYDSKDRLLQEVSARASGYTNLFSYDSAGNSTSFKGQSRIYNGQNQRTGSGFAYDSQGNPTTYGGTSVAYTPNGQPIIFGSVMSADYTSGGLRAWKQNGVGSSGTRTYFLYDGTTPVVELDEYGDVVAVNTFGANGLLARRTGTDSVFYAFDERGTTTHRLDSSGTILSSHMVDAFGTVAFTTATNDPYAGFEAQHGYYTDTETGLILCTFRYYDPIIGRWLTRDPVGYNGGINLYGYVANNPLTRTDAIGLWSWSGFGTGIAKAAIGVVVGVVVGAVVAATAPAWLAAGLAVGAAAVGGWMMGQTFYEASSGQEWSASGNGRQLCDDEISERVGESLVNLATIGLSGSRWMNRGASNDADWLRMKPSQRFADENGKLTVSNETFQKLQSLPPDQRTIRLRDISPKNYKQTWSSGASPGIRFTTSFSQLGAGAVGRRQF